MIDRNFVSAKIRPVNEEAKKKEFEMITEPPKHFEKTKSTEDTDIIFNSTKHIKKDILLFKDEILREIKLFQTKITEKAKNNEQYMKEKIEKFSSQTEGFGEKIIELSNLIVTDKTIREKVEQLIEFRKKTEDSIMTDEIKIDNLEKDFYNNIYRIDNILTDTVLNSKIIGGIAKFNTFFDFMKFVLDDLSQLNTFKDKTISDLNIYRTKLENYAHKSKLQIENTEKDCKLYTDKFILKTEYKMNDLFEEYNNRLNDIKLKNVAFTENMKKIADDLLGQMNAVAIIKDEIFRGLEEQNIRYSKLIKAFTSYKEDFYNIKKKYIEICNVLKYKGNITNINLDYRSPIKSAFKNKRRNTKQFKNPGTFNVLKAAFNHDNISENKNDDLNIVHKKTMDLRTTINFSLNKRQKFEDMSLEKKTNIKPYNILFDGTPKNITNITKTVIKPFKRLNNSNHSSEYSVIKEEENAKETNTQEDKSSQSDKNKSNKSLIKENKISINKNEEKEENNQKTSTNRINNEKDNIIKRSLTIKQNKVKNYGINKNITNYSTNNNKILNELSKRNDNESKNKINNYKPLDNNNYKRHSEINSYDQLNKITLSLEGINNYEIFAKSKDNDYMDKEMLKNVKNMIKRAKTIKKPNNGYPKIVTNNGERIIISTRPINNNKKFVNYTNPNILALNNCVKKLYGNKNSKKSGMKSNIIDDENEFDYYFENNLQTNVFENTMKNLKNNLYDNRINSAEQNKIFY